MSTASPSNDPRLLAAAALIRDVPDFPKPGIRFKDITPLIGDGAAFRAVIDALAERAGPLRADVIVGIESRGFIFGAALADRMSLGFVPVRKPGKLPWRAVRETYALEYGTDALEMHEDAVTGKRCLVIDDVLATGGTAAATVRLVERGGGTLAGVGFVIELGFLGGRARIPNHEVISLLSY